MKAIFQTNSEIPTSISDITILIQLTTKHVVRQLAMRISLRLQFITEKALSQMYVLPDAKQILSEKSCNFGIDFRCRFSKMFIVTVTHWLWQKETDQTGLC